MSFQLTMLFYDMNGEPLSFGHGAPLRLRNETQLGFTQMKWSRTTSSSDTAIHVDHGRLIAQDRCTIGARRRTVHKRLAFEPRNGMSGRGRRVVAGRTSPACFRPAAKAVLDRPLFLTAAG